MALRDAARASLVRIMAGAGASPLLAWLSFTEEGRQLACLKGLQSRHGFVTRTKPFYSPTRLQKFHFKKIALPEVGNLTKRAILVEKDVQITVKLLVYEDEFIENMTNFQMCFSQFFMILTLKSGMAQYTLVDKITNLCLQRVL